MTSSHPSDEPDLSADIRLAAMNLLARREHSQQELRRKLKRRFSDENSIDEQLSRLVDERLLCDARFAEAYVRQRGARGYGPLRLREELRERGVSDERIDVALAEADIDWSELAADVVYKKFGGNAPADIKEKARQIRFIQYRGFSADHYRKFMRD